MTATLAHEKPLEIRLSRGLVYLMLFFCMLIVSLRIHDVQRKLIIRGLNGLFRFSLVQLHEPALRKKDESY